MSPIRRSTHEMHLNLLSLYVATFLELHASLYFTHKFSNCYRKELYYIPCSSLLEFERRTEYSDAH